MHTSATSRLRSLAVAAALTTAGVLAAPSAAAFCGFYVAGADQKLFNNATMVVLMREGTRTVLSMQNNYQGPPENFAMVVPVPVVLQKENVKTLPMAVFDKIDKLASPRLVEYWEQDPCWVPQWRGADKRAMPMDEMEMEGGAPEKDKKHGVKIEAQFKVGEYEIVILSARDSLGLDTWLRQERYQIPAGAEPLLRPYVQAGAKFFVAKVDPKKVVFKGGMAQLSPLRFHYDSETFALPVRLGLVNSAGVQDLIVHILARGQRYESANYTNVAIPTNLDVKDEVRSKFGSFYAALFDRTLSRHPRAAVTEYAWDASTCDPCPGPTLDESDFATLGEDVLAGGSPEAAEKRGWRGGGMVLTRLHMRYGKDTLGEDLVFRAAPPIVGGREFLRDGKAIETGAVQDETNNFQARYIIRHPWTGPIACKNPIRGRWGGPPGGKPSPDVGAATNAAFAPRGQFEIARMIQVDNAETKIDSGPLVPAPAMYAAAPAAPPPAPANSASSSPPPDNAVPSPPPTPPQSGCAGCRVGDASHESVSLGATIAAGLGLMMARWLRRKNR